MKILVACEYSGRVREAFKKLGHDAWSCDLLPSDDNSPYHMQDEEDLASAYTDVQNMGLPLQAIVFRNQLRHQIKQSIREWSK